MGWKLATLGRLAGKAGGSALGFVTGHAKTLAIIGLVALLGTAAIRWAGVAGKYLDNAAKDRAALIDARVTVATKTVEAQEAQDTIRRLEEEKAFLRKLSQNLVASQDQIRQDLADTRADFEKHDLGRAVEAHPKWLEDLANEATRKKFDELQDLFNRPDQP